MLVCLSVWPGAGCEPFFVYSATLTASEQVIEHVWMDNAPHDHTL